MSQLVGQFQALWVSVTPGTDNYHVTANIRLTIILQTRLHSWKELGLQLWSAILIHILDGNMMLPTGAFLYLALQLLRTFTLYFLYSLWPQQDHEPSHNHKDVLILCVELPANVGHSLVLHRLTFFEGVNTNSVPFNNLGRQVLHYKTNTTKVY